MVPEVLELEESVNVDYNDGVPEVVITVPGMNSGLRCIRNTDKIPADCFDGDAVPVSNNIIRDNGVIGGRRYFYLINTDSGASYTVGPVEVFPGVACKNLTIMPDKLSVIYMHPENSSSVEIYRSAGQGAEYLVDRSKGAGLDIFEDSDVKEDTEYTYRLKAVYNGGSSDYTSVSGKIKKYPDPIKIVLIRKQGHRIVVGLTNPDFELYFSEKPLDDGHFISGIPDDIVHLETVRISSVEFEVSLEDDLFGYVYPILQVSGAVVIGYPVKVSTLRDVADVKYNFESDRVRISVTCPEKITHLLCMYNRTRPPLGPDDSDSEMLSIPLKILKAKQDSFDFRMDFSKVYVKIFCMYPGGVHSDGYEKLIVRKKDVVRYAFKEGRRSSIEFEVEGDLDVIPPMLICSGAFGYPRDINSGTVMGEIPALNVIKNKASFQYQTGSFNPNNTALFVKGQDSAGITLVHNRK